MELAGRTAVVTGSGSGIGRGMALAFAEARMSLVLADLDTNAARRVAEEVRRLGTRALVVETDVGSRASVEALAEAAYALTGEVHLLCNNAGVTTFGTLGEIPYDDWRWVLQVNLFGVIHGLQSFLPRMRTQRGPKHVVNTASIAGCAGLPGLAAYCASKHAVVGISETLAREGAAWGLGCTVVCPGNTHTRIAESERNRPPEMGERRPTADVVKQTIATGMDPIVVGQIVRRAVVDGDLFVFTHPESRALVEGRSQALLAAIEKAELRAPSEPLAPDAQRP